MPKKQITTITKEEFVCEVCDRHFSTLEDAEKCEKSHVQNITKVYPIPNLGYTKIYDFINIKIRPEVYNQYPTYIDITFDNGNTIRYSIAASELSGNYIGYHYFKNPIPYVDWDKLREDFKGK